MASGSISSAFAEKSSGPYSKPIKCKVMAAGEPVAYNGKDGATKKVLTVAVSDGQEVVKVMAYDETKFKYLKVGQTLVVRETIRRSEADGRVLVVTSVTKIFLTTPLTNVPDEHQRTAKLLVNPPPADKVTVKEALSSPAKKKITVAGRIVQEDEPRTVTVQGQDVTIKTVTIDDGSEKAKVTLWRDLAMTEVRPGDFVLLTDVVTNYYKNKTTLSTTTKSKVEMVDAPEEEKNIEVEGICKSGDTTELFLQDESIMVVPSELLSNALATTENPDVDVEMATAEGILKLNVTVRGGEVLKILKQ